VTARFHIVEPAGALDLARVKELFTEYVTWLNEDLAFQGFGQELAELPGGYARPDGRLFLAMADGQAAGCIALRRFDATSGEVKRMWVRPAFRGQGTARALLALILEEARLVPYRRLVLDTLARMTDAIALYRAAGFRDIPAYYHNPLPNPIYLALDL
jgi:carbonic anhydrase